MEIIEGHTARLIGAENYELIAEELPMVEPDWNQIKTQAAIAAMSALITGQFAEQTGKSISRSKTAAESVLFADSLITELKKQTR